MITPIIENLRKAPQVLVENKISFAGPESELSIYDTYQQAQRVKLKSDQLLFWFRYSFSFLFFACLRLPLKAVTGGMN